MIQTLMRSSLYLYSTLFLFLFNDTATTEIYTLSLHYALPISSRRRHTRCLSDWSSDVCRLLLGSEEHTTELQSLRHLVCRLLLEKKNQKLAATPLRRCPTKHYLRTAK